MGRIPRVTKWNYPSQLCWRLDFSQLFLGRNEEKNNLAGCFCKLSSLKTQAKTWHGFSVNPAHDLFTLNKSEAWEMISRGLNMVFLDKLKNLFLMKDLWIEIVKRFSFQFRYLAQQDHLAFSSIQSKNMNHWAYTH